MGEVLKQQPEYSEQPDPHQRAVEELTLYLLSYRSKEHRAPDDPSRKDGDAHYLEARRLGELCGAETAQLLEEAATKIEGIIDVPHRLSDLKDHIPEAVRERCIFH